MTDDLNRIHEAVAKHRRVAREVRLHGGLPERIWIAVHRGDPVVEMTADDARALGGCSRLEVSAPTRAAVLSEDPDSVSRPRLGMDFGVGPLRAGGLGVDIHGARVSDEDQADIAAWFNRLVEDADPQP